MGFMETMQLEMELLERDLKLANDKIKSNELLLKERRVTK